jgi:hypothetical protein
LVGNAQTTSIGNQIGTNRDRAVQSLSPPPSLDLCMIALSEHHRDIPAAKIGWSGELGLFQKAIGSETLRHRAIGIAHGSRKKPGHSLNDQTCTHFSTRQHDVTNADLGVDEVFTHPMVDTFVSSAQQTETTRWGQMRECKVSCECLIEPSTAWAEQEKRPRWIDSFDRCENRFGPHDHSCSPTKGSIVHAAVYVDCELPQVVATQIEESRLATLSEKALRTETVHKTGENREDVHPHFEPSESDSYSSNKPSGGSTTTVNAIPSSLDTLVTKFTGIKAPESSSIRSLAGLAITDRHRP